MLFICFLCYTQECLQLYVFCSALHAFGMGKPRIPAATKMEHFMPLWQILLFERAQFDFFFYIESQESRELSVCVWQMSFSALFLLNEIMVPKFINNSHLKQNPRPLHQQRS